MLRVVIGKAEVSQENKYRWGEKSISEMEPCLGNKNI